MRLLFFFAVVLGLGVLGLFACSSGESYEAMRGAQTFDEAERVALDRLLAQAGVAPRDVRMHRDLYEITWPGAKAHLARHGLGSRHAKIDRHTIDAQNSIVIAEGHVRALRLTRTHLSDLSLMSEFPKLVMLDLHDAEIPRIEGLSGLAELDHLDLSGNRIEVIAGFAGLSSLRSLYLAQNHLQRIGALSDLPGLEELNLSSNQIRKIEGLDALRSLRILSLEHNPIHRVEGLSLNDAIVDLNLSFCEIEQIEGIEPLKNLVYLQLWHNRITLISGIEDVPSLYYVGLGENPYVWSDPTNQRIVGDFGRGRLICLM